MPTFRVEGFHLVDDATATVTLCGALDDVQRLCPIGAHVALLPVVEVAMRRREHRKGLLDAWQSSGRAWLPGMAAEVDGTRVRVLDVDDDGPLRVSHAHGVWKVRNRSGPADLYAWADALPDLEDAVTVALLQCLPKAAAESTPADTTEHEKLVKRLRRARELTRRLLSILRDHNCEDGGFMPGEFLIIQQVDNELREEADV